jgi:Ca2+-binding EF-hand superfamily protein
MFNRIDTSDDRRISLEEFTSKLPELRKWGATLEDAEAEFRRIDYP